MFDLEIVHVLVMHINNIIPVIVERSARIAAHRKMCDMVSISYEKKKVHRAYRRRVSIELHKITIGLVDSYEYDDSPAPYQKLTSRDIL